MHQGKIEESSLKEALLHTKKDSGKTSEDAATERKDSSKETENKNIFIRCLNCILNALKFIYKCVACLFRKRKLTNLQKKRLNKLKERGEIRFDSNKIEHINGIKLIWENTFRDVPWTGQKTEKWKEMGWQGIDPETDIRGGGYMSIENILYMSNKYPVAYNDLVWKRKGERSEWEYPFAIAGINITFQLKEMFQLRKYPNLIMTDAYIYGILNLLNVTENLFDEIYCIMFKLLDKKWLEAKASYMEFSLIMNKTIDDIKEALKQQPRDLKEFETILNI